MVTLSHIYIVTWSFMWGQVRQQITVSLFVVARSAWNQCLAASMLTPEKDKYPNQCRISSRDSSLMLMDNKCKSEKSHFSWSTDVGSHMFLSRHFVVETCEKLTTARVPLVLQVSSQPVLTSPGRLCECEEQIWELMNGSVLTCWCLQSQRGTEEARD